MPLASRPDFVLDEQLCFALHAASRAMTSCYRPLLDGIGLTYSQYAVMLVLWEQESVTLGLLCARLQLDTGTLSPLLKRLAAEGLLTRRRRAEDERTVQLALTQRGRELEERAAAIQSRVQEATGLRPGELAALRDELHGLAARLRAEHLQPEPV
jgi:MarR family transcriptional regulator, organic hydroperoxide resistance regulator